VGFSALKERYSKSYVKQSGSGVVIVMVLLRVGCASGDCAGALDNAKGCNSKLMVLAMNIVDAIGEN
jgi:hypothetical protein